MTNLILDKKYVINRWKNFLRPDCAFDLEIEWKKMPKNREKESQVSKALRERLATALTEQKGGTTNVFTTTTHNSELVVVVGWVNPSHAPIYLGVDVEKIDRPVTERAFNRLMSSEKEREYLRLLNPIDFWVIKEACFKANPKNQGSFVSEYEVKTVLEASGGESEMVDYKGSVERLFDKSQYEFYLMRYQGLSFALAQCI